MKLATKITKTTVREYDEDGELVSEVKSTETERFAAEPPRVVGFSKPVEIAK